MKGERWWGRVSRLLRVDLSETLDVKDAPRRLIIKLKSLEQDLACFFSPVTVEIFILTWGLRANLSLRGRTRNWISNFTNKTISVGGVCFTLRLTHLENSILGRRVLVSLLRIKRVAGSHKACTTQLPDASFTGNFRVKTRPTALGVVRKDNSS